MITGRLEGAESDQRDTAKTVLFFWDSLNRQFMERTEVTIKASIQPGIMKFSSLSWITVALMWPNISNLTLRRRRM